jgi:hypothetical protein
MEELNGLNILDCDHPLVRNLFTVDLVNKRYELWSHVKDDVESLRCEYEYRVKADPVRVESRLVQRLEGPPPGRCVVKDGVVLEAEILSRHTGDSRMLAMMTYWVEKKLKIEIEWHSEAVWEPISMYLLSKHSEIVSRDEFRKHLRGLAQGIESATLKVEKFLEAHAAGLEVTDDYTISGRSIWYPESQREAMSAGEIRKAVKRVGRIKERLFNEGSEDYVGISETEFRLAPETLRTIEMYLSGR